MLFKLYRPISFIERPAFVKNLTERELHHLGIHGPGTTVDIKFLNKEVVHMVEQLKAYRAETVADLEALKNATCDEELAKELADFEAKYREAFEANKVEKIAAQESDLRCIDSLISKELAKEAEAQLIINDVETNVNIVE